MKKSLLTLLLLPICAILYSQVLVKQWDYTYGGTDNDFFRTLYVSPGGSIYLYGYSDSGVGADKDSARGGSDYWVVKLNASGQLLWEKVYGGSSVDIGNKIIPASDGNLFLLGGSGSGISGDKSEPGRGNWDYWVLKIDTDGNKLWDKTIGGNGPEVPSGICATINGGCILGGYSTSDISGDKTEAALDPTHFYDDYWAVKLDANGNKVWDHVYGGVANDIMSAAVDAGDGGAIIGGLSRSAPGNNRTPPVFGEVDYWIIKIDSVGNRIWDKSYGGDD